MPVFVYFEDENSENHQFSNLNFVGIIEFAEDSGASSDVLCLLNQGGLMRGVWIEGYSFETF